MQLPEPRSQTIGFKVTPATDKEIRDAARALNISITELMNRVWVSWLAGKRL
jgi:hypothetical protein